MRRKERKGSEIRKEERTEANGESTSVRGWRSWQAGDTKELTALITMGHYGHSAVGHYINGPPLSTISPTGRSRLLSSQKHSFRNRPHTRLKLPYRFSTLFQRHDKAPERPRSRAASRDT